MEVTLATRQPTILRTVQLTHRRFSAGLVRHRSQSCIFGLSNFAAILVVLVILSPVAAAHGDDHPPALRNGRNQFTFFKSQKPAPRMHILAEGGGVRDLGRFPRKLVLLNFWATWCPPCVDELPALDRLQALLGNDVIAVVALSIDEGDIGLPVSFVRRLGLRNLDVYLDITGAAQDAFPLYGLPITYLIDPNGSVVGYIVGVAKWASPEAVEFLRHYMDVGNFEPAKG